MRNQVAPVITKASWLTTTTTSREMYFSYIPPCNQQLTSISSTIKLSFGGIPVPSKPGTFLKKNFQGCIENLYYNGVNIIDLAKRRKHQIYSVVSHCLLTDGLWTLGKSGFWYSHWVCLMHVEFSPSKAWYVVKSACLACMKLWIPFPPQHKNRHVC